jgi:hypothetical protein
MTEMAAAIDPKTQSKNKKKKEDSKNERAEIAYQYTLLHYYYLISKTIGTKSFTSFESCNAATAFMTN